MSSSLAIPARVGARFQSHPHSERSPRDAVAWLPVWPGQGGPMVEMAGSPQHAMPEDRRAALSPREARLARGAGSPLREPSAGPAPAAGAASVSRRAASPDARWGLDASWATTPQTPTYILEWSLIPDDRASATGASSPDAELPAADAQEVEAARLSTLSRLEGHENASAQPAPSTLGGEQPPEASREALTIGALLRLTPPELSEARRLGPPRRGRRSRPSSGEGYQPIAQALESLSLGGATPLPLGTRSRPVAVAAPRPAPWSQGAHPAARRLSMHSGGRPSPALSAASSMLPDSPRSDSGIFSFED